jgi:hypothetical protein
MPNLVASFRRLPRDVQLYAWASFLIGIGSFGIWAVLFKLYLQRLGMGPEAIGLLGNRVNSSRNDRRPHGQPAGDEFGRDHHYHRFRPAPICRILARRTPSGLDHNMVDGVLAGQCPQ